MRETLVRFLGREDPLEKGQATHSSVLRLPLWLNRYRICLQCERPGFDAWVVFWPGEFHGQPMRLQTAGQTQQLSFSLTSPQLLYNIKKKKKNFETSLDTFKKLLKFIIIINVKSREKTKCNDNKKARDLDLEN